VNDRDKAAALGVATLASIVGTQMTGAAIAGNVAVFRQAFLASAAFALAGGLVALWVRDSDAASTMRSGQRDSERAVVAAGFRELSESLGGLWMFLLTLLFGTEPETIFPSVMSPVRIVGGVAISNWDLQAVGLTLAMLTALYLLIRFTRDGQFMLAVADNEKLAEIYGVGREAQDEFALRSHQRAKAAWESGFYERWVVPVPDTELDRDENIRPDTTLEVLAGLKTPFRPHGRVTAGNSAGLNDGATGCVIAAQDVAAELGLDARMRLIDFSYAGVDPEVMGIGPVPATETVLARNDLTIDDIGLIEINEAFAVQVLAFLDHFKIDDDDPRVNPWGGAIALGHPLASSGARLMIQLARQLAERPDVRFGLTTMCVGMGMGGTVLWENLNA